MKEVFDSLELSALCKKAFNPAGLGMTPSAYKGTFPEDVSAVAYVASHEYSASDLDHKVSAIGDPDRPFRTVHAAIAAIRALDRAAGVYATIVLRKGTHYVGTTLELTAADSNLTFTNYPGEPVSLSGAAPLKTSWVAWGPNPADPSPDPKMIYVADLDGQGVKDIPGLRVGGRRGVRASFPDRDPETSIYPKGWVTDQTNWIAPRPPAKNETFVTVPEPMLHDKTMFQNYMVGIGGHCSKFTPPVSYWCSEHPSGGGAFSFRVPSGLTYVIYPLFDGAGTRFASATVRKCLYAIIVSHLALFGLNSPLP